MKGIKKILILLKFWYLKNVHKFRTPKFRKFRNRNLRAFSPKNNDNTIQKNEDLNNNLSYIRRGYYNSQLNFPYDRYEN